MAVKVFCSICDRFIKDVDNSEFGRLDGREICTDCGGKVDEIFADLNKGVADFKKALAEKHADMSKRYASLKKGHDRFEADIKSLYTSMSAELNRRKEDILK